jgi:hypothetical protein
MTTTPPPVIRITEQEAHHEEWRRDFVRAAEQSARNEEAGWQTTALLDAGAGGEESGCVMKKSAQKTLREAERFRTTLTKRMRELKAQKVMTIDDVNDQVTVMFENIRSESIKAGGDKDLSDCVVFPAWRPDMYFN